MKVVERIVLLIMVAVVVYAMGAWSCAHASGAPIDARVFDLVLGVLVVFVALGIAALVVFVVKWPRAGAVLLAIMLGFLAGRASAASVDVIFADGFGADACDGCSEGGEPPALCTPTPPDYPPSGLQWGGTQTLASLPEVGFDRFTQLKMQGGTWRAYTFTRADMPGDVSAWNGDTSNTGGAPGADVRIFNVSECEGDFRNLVPGCYGNVGEGPFVYANFSGDATAGTCPLDTAKSYYFNVHMGPAPCNSGGPNLCAFRFVIR
jgi:hypothetical protein